MHSAALRTGQDVVINRNWYREFGDTSERKPSGDFGFIKPVAGYYSPTVVQDRFTITDKGPDLLSPSLERAFIISRIFGCFNESLDSSETAEWVLRFQNSELKMETSDIVTLARRYHSDNFGRKNRDVQMKSYVSIIRTLMKNKGN